MMNDECGVMNAELANSLFIILYSSFVTRYSSFVIRYFNSFFPIFPDNPSGHLPLIPNSLRS